MCHGPTSLGSREVRRRTGRRRRGFRAKSWKLCHPYGKDVQKRSACMSCGMDGDGPRLVDRGTNGRLTVVCMHIRPRLPFTNIRGRSIRELLRVWKERVGQTVFED